MSEFNEQPGRPQLPPLVRDVTVDDWEPVIVGGQLAIQRNGPMQRVTLLGNGEAAMTKLADFMGQHDFGDILQVPVIEE